MKWKEFCWLDLLSFLKKIQNQIFFTSKKINLHKIPAEVVEVLLEKFAFAPKFAAKPAGADWELAFGCCDTTVKDFGATDDPSTGLCCCEVNAVFWEAAGEEVDAAFFWTTSWDVKDVGRDNVWADFMEVPWSTDIADVVIAGRDVVCTFFWEAIWVAGADPADAERRGVAEFPNLTWYADLTTQILPAFDNTVPSA